nr:hemagglutinin repeat-containing protein [Yersinia enterocolitica]
MQGAQVSGETVKADVGRDLLLQSQQDSDRYDSKQQDATAVISAVSLSATWPTAYWLEPTMKAMTIAPLMRRSRMALSLSAVPINNSKMSLT